MGKALILYGGNEFADSGRTARAHLTAKGFDSHATDCLATPWDEIKHPRGAVDIMAWYSHGGWDGPLFLPIPQANRNDEDWAKLKEWFSTRIVRNGLFVSHACHSAGSNRYETYSDRRWVQEVAADMLVYAVGVEGMTSSADRYHAVALLDFALSAQRPKQAARVYQPGGAQVGNWTGWLRLGAGGRAQEGMGRAR
jgi:hypothetical protein